VDHPLSRSPPCQTAHGVIGDHQHGIEAFERRSVSIACCGSAQ
jgi:hypothetical protein